MSGNLRPGKTWNEQPPVNNLHRPDGSTPAGDSAACYGSRSNRAERFPFGPGWSRARSGRANPGRRGPERYNPSDEESGIQERGGRSNSSRSRSRSKNSSRPFLTLFMETGSFWMMSSR